MNGYKVTSQQPRQRGIKVVSNLVAAPHNSLYRRITIAACRSAVSQNNHNGRGLHIRKCVLRSNTYDICHSVRTTQTQLLPPLVATSWLSQLPRSMCTLQFLIISLGGATCACPQFCWSMSMLYAHTCAKMCATVTVITRHLQPAMQCPLSWLKMLR